jgi:hypothetical protein
MSMVLRALWNSEKRRYENQIQQLDDDSEEANQNLEIISASWRKATADMKKIADELATERAEHHRLTVRRI